jgi:glycosyltransferase involved in cell wall biosynthesis
MQHIPEGLSRRSWKVDYFSVPSSLGDIIGKRRRERISRVWLKSQWRGWKINKNLTEYCLPSVFPPSRKLLFFDWQLETYKWFIPQHLRLKAYDVCICDCTPSAVYLPFFRFRNLIFRLNDPVEWQARPIQKILRTIDKRSISTHIWAVSQPLGNLASRLYPQLPLRVYPNCVDLNAFFKNPDWSKTDPPKKAVFIGSFERRIDQQLIVDTAKLLPDWTFRLIGSHCHHVDIHAKNIKLLGHLPHSQLPDILSNYSVGLIPIRADDPDMRFLESPLKFYEYLAVGIGIAATRAGKMEKTLGAWAKFGDTPKEFAKAITDARAGLPHDADKRRAFCERHSWDRLVDAFDAAISQMIRHNPSTNKVGH